MSGEPGSGTGPHPIGVVSARTGLAPEVIRVWERRYGAVHPMRDTSGARLYSDEEVERLRLLARATGSGRRIGRVARLDSRALREMVEEDEAARGRSGRAAAPTGSGDPAAAVTRSLDFVRSLDGEALERHLQRQAVLLGLPAFLEHVIGPLFHAVGEEWHAGRLRVAQEHLASSVARSLLARLIGSSTDGEARPRIVVATPSGERHEIGALMVAALSHAEGWRVAYLGPDLPPREIVDAALDTEARAVALSLVYREGGDLSDQIGTIRRGLPVRMDVLVGGPAVEVLAKVRGLTRFEDVRELRRYLSEIAAEDAGR